MDVLAWLRDSDPALRWQVERDLAGEPPSVWAELAGRPDVMTHSAPPAPARCAASV
jgi:hypothetical protein